MNRSPVSSPAFVGISVSFLSERWCSECCLPRPVCTACFASNASRHNASPRLCTLAQSCVNSRRGCYRSRRPSAAGTRAVFLLWFVLFFFLFFLVFVFLLLFFW